MMKLDMKVILLASLSLIMSANNVFCHDDELVIYNTIIPYFPGETVPKTSFWKYTILVDQFLKGGHAVKALPDYLSETDFPPLTQDAIPFAKGINTVRILGGWHPSWNSGEAAAPATFEVGDVFDEDANLNETKFLDRLRPYARVFDPNLRITDITVVLDNTPATLTGDAGPEYGTFGQKNPPKNRTTSFRIANRVGSALLKEFPDIDFRFRVGTEANDVERFNGTNDIYFAHLASSMDGITNHIDPDYLVMPYNAKGISGSDFSSTGDVSMEVNAKLLAATDRDYPVQPVSLYVRIINPDTPEAYFAKTLETRLADMLSYWDKIDAAYGKAVGREVHEFGLQKEGTVVKYAQKLTVQNAALHAEGIMRFARANIDRLYHWNDVLTPDRNLAPTGWVYSVLESMVNGYWAFPEIKTTSADPRTSYFSAISLLDLGERSIMMVSALNPNEKNEEYKTPAIRIPYTHIPEYVNLRLDSPDICVTWIRDSWVKEDLSVDSDGINAIKGSLSIKSLSSFQDNPGTVIADVIADDVQAELVIKLRKRTNSVTAIVFDQNCEE